MHIGLSVKSDDMRATKSSIAKKIHFEISGNFLRLLNA